MEPHVTESVKTKIQKRLSASMLRFLLSPLAGLKTGKHAGGWISRDRDLVQKEKKALRLRVRASRRANRGS
jgi:hypothetical protein